MRLKVFGWVLLTTLLGQADEGMWLFNEPPTALVEERYGFRMEDEWLDHLRESSVRFNSGGSGAFVSKDGLILTNHHVGAGAIASLSRADRDLLRDGFHAVERESELICDGLELNVLVSIRDVTDEVQSVVSHGMAADVALKKRRAVIAELEQVPEEESLRTQRSVVTLYQGGAYHLYQYRRYTDVRLVFAPESAVAAFGGDADNFEYPRFCLDFALFRAYEDGRPAQVPHFLKWSAAGAQEGELAFVTGHPGSTDRGLTHAQVKSQRDRWMPYSLEMAKRREVLLTAWSLRDLENQRRAKRPLVGTQNWRKAVDGRLVGLLDPQFMARHQQAELGFRKQLQGDDRGALAEAAFRQIEEVVKRQDKEGFAGALLGGGDAFDSRLFGLALTLVEHAHEQLKPDAERRSGHRDTDRVSRELSLFSENPIYKDMEQVRLADSLSFMAGKLGAEDPRVILALAGKSPRVRAKELVEGSDLEAIEVRRALYEGGLEAVQTSQDPMLILARDLFPEIESFTHAYEQDEETLKQCHERISKARFELRGDSGYPDATFTLRLSFGEITGIEREDVPYQTTFGGLYERRAKQGSLPPFDLPARWLEAEAKVGRQTALNFISTHDITGGNSGSPVVNRKGELIGLIFDSNLAGLTNDVAYDEARGRAVSVDSAGILRSLDAVYGAQALVEELSARH